MIKYSQKSERFETDQLANTINDSQMQTNMDNFFSKLSSNKLYSHLSRRGPLLFFIGIITLLFIAGLSLIISSAVLNNMGKRNLDLYYNSTYYVLDNTSNKTSNNTSNNTSNTTINSNGNTTSNNTGNTTNNNTSNTTNNNNSNTTTNTTGNTTTNSSRRLQTNQPTNSPVNATNQQDGSTDSVNNYIWGNLKIAASNATAVSAFIIGINFLVLLVVFMIFVYQQKKSYNEIRQAEFFEIESLKQTCGNSVTIVATHERKMFLGCQLYWIFEFKFDVSFVNSQEKETEQLYVEFGKNDELDITDNNDFATDNRMQFASLGLNQNTQKNML